MGVTIHYTGVLSSPAQVELLLLESSLFANELQWKYEITIYPCACITMFPHPDCEPLTFNPDENGRVDNWVKTQFAGPETHIQIVDFLARITPFFETLTVQDEAEFWETRDRTVLEGHIDQITEMIGDMQRENPSAKAKVREANGRIVDLIT